MTQEPRYICKHFCNSRCKTWSIPHRKCKQRSNMCPTRQLHLRLCESSRDWATGFVHLSSTPGTTVYRKTDPDFWIIGTRTYTITKQLVWHVNLLQIKVFDILIPQEFDPGNGEHMPKGKLAFRQVETAKANAERIGLNEEWIITEPCSTNFMRNLMPRTIFPGPDIKQTSRTSDWFEGQKDDAHRSRQDSRIPRREDAMAAIGCAVFFYLETP